MGAFYPPCLNSGASKIPSLPITTTFNPIKKILNPTPQTIDLKNPPNPPSKHSLETPYRNRASPVINHILNKLDDFVTHFLDLPFHPSTHPRNVLSDNFAPVHELPPTACTVVEGSLPPGLDGAYIRNGPNPHLDQTGPYHFLDGDGMLHMIKISRGEVTFCSRYVKTHKYITESRIGRLIVPNFFACLNGRALAIAARVALAVAWVFAGQFDPMNHGFGVANTSVVQLGDRLLALCESDLPYEVRVTDGGDIVTIGRHDFQAKDSLRRMTAHPKVDGETGEVFCYEYDIFRPFLTFYRIDAGGKKQKGVPIFSVNRCALIHDFAVTQNYAVFCHGGIVVDPSRVLRGKPPVGVDLGEIPRVGIIEKQAVDGGGMQWFEAPGFNMLHCANGWEEDGGGTVVMVASNIGSAESILEIADSPHMKLEKVRIDVREKTVVRQSLSGEFLDFAVINPAYAGKKNRYVYAAILGFKRLVGVVKLDLSLADEMGGDCTVGRRLYGPGGSGGEPFFVAREPNNPAAEEDDGYLIMYVHYENSRESEFLVMDAKSPTLDVVASVKLPQRVPNGIHGLFVSENDLKKLRKL